MVQGKFCSRYELSAFFELPQNDASGRDFTTVKTSLEGKVLFTFFNSESSLKHLGIWRVPDFASFPYSGESAVI